MNVPSIRARITLRPDLDHPRWPNRARYMPHIVIDGPSQRGARIGAGNTILEHYLGVLIEDAPDELIPGCPEEVTLRLMYWPDLQYEEVVPGGTFTIREGPNIVGSGEIIGPRIECRPVGPVQ